MALQLTKLWETIAKRQVRTLLFSVQKELGVANRKAVVLQHLKQQKLASFPGLLSPNVVEGLVKLLRKTPT